MNSYRIFPREEKLSNSSGGSLFSWLTAVNDILNDPPLNPVSGDRYIINTNPTGDWIGHANDIVQYDGTTWTYTTPFPGNALYVKNLDDYYIFNGTQWIQNDNIIEHNDLNGLQGGDINHRYHLELQQYSDLTGGDNASNQHIHDDRYYTETEVDDLIDTHQHQASEIIVDASGYSNNGILKNSDTTTQAALNRINNSIKYDNIIQSYWITTQ